MNDKPLSTKDWIIGVLAIVALVVIVTTVFSGVSLSDAPLTDGL